MERIVGNKAPDSETNGKSISAPSADTSSFSEKEEVIREISLSSESPLTQISVQQISFSPYQTRVIESDSELEALSDSLLRSGMIQPILVRPLADSEEGGRGFELVAGERRLRAARLAGLRTVPAIVQSLSDQEATELSVVENAQRSDLNPIEQAKAFSLLAKQFKLAHREIAELAGKSRAAVSNSLRLLQLAEQVQEMICTGEISEGHGRVLLGVEDAKVQIRLAKRTASNELSVKALSVIVERVNAGRDEEELSEEEEKALAALIRQENKVADYLGLEEVALKRDSEGRRRLNLVFDTEASWKRFMSRIRD